jgi:hypothetical protein
MPAAPNRSTNLVGLVSARTRILITASSISLAASRQPCARSVPASVNPIYTGRIAHKGAPHPGQQPALIARRKVLGSAEAAGSRRRA